MLENSSDYGRGQLAFNVGGEIHTLRIDAGKGRQLMEAIESGVMVVSIAAIAAAPFTSGASLYLLLPLGVIGAVPSAYRLYNRADAHTLRFDIQSATDVVNIVAGFVGLAEAATPLRLVRLGKVLMITGVGANGAGLLLMGAGIVQQIEALRGLPEGERAARLLEIIGSALLQLGIQAGGMIGQVKYQKHPEGTVVVGEVDPPGFHARPEGEVTGQAPKDAPSPGSERTMAGLGPPGGPPAPAPGSTPQHPQHSPERLLERLSQGVDRELHPPRPSSEVARPASPGYASTGLADNHFRKRRRWAKLSLEYDMTHFLLLIWAIGCRLRAASYGP